MNVPIKDCISCYSNAIVCVCAIHSGSLHVFCCPSIMSFMLAC